MGAQGPSRGAGLTALCGGDGDRPAITLGDDRLTYARLRAAVAAMSAPAAGPSPDAGAILDLSGRSWAGALVGILAAAAQQRPALIADPIAPPALPEPSQVPAGTGMLLGTSGSTGRPKLIARTLRSWTDSFADLSQLSGITAEDRVLLTGPVHSTLQLFGALHALWVGAELTDRADRATAAHAVPAVLADLVDGRAPGLRRVVVAGAALPSALARLAHDTGVRVLEYYGAAELSVVAARTPPGKLRPFPGAEVSIRDGVLWARSPYLATGYAGPDADQLRRAPDGFATVGDRADLRPDGSIALRGRGDTAVSVGGVTILTEEVEKALRTIDGVLDAAVTGLPHARLGQVVAAAVVLAPDQDLSAVRTAARTLLRGEARPVRWSALAALPRLPGGKVDRTAMTAMLTSRNGF